MLREITLRIRNTLIGGIIGLLFGYWLTTMMPSIESLAILIIIVGFIVIGGVVGFNANLD